MFSGLRAFFGKIRSIFVRKESVPPPPPQMSFQPYKDTKASMEYNMLFCDNMELFRPAGKPGGIWKVLFAREPVIDALKTIADDNKVETRTRLLAFNALRRRGIINAKEVLGVVIEVGVAEGNETAAVYKDLRARYLNGTGRVMVWENNAIGTGINEKIQNILAVSQKIIGKAEQWKQPRPAPPAAGDFRITFLAADAAYLGEGKLAEIKSDPVAAALIGQAAELMTALNKNAREAKANAPVPAPPAAPGKTPAAAPVNTAQNNVPAAAANSVLKITVLQNGEVRIGNKIVTLRETESQIAQLAAKKGAVWFYREQGRNPPPPQATEVIKLAVKYKVPVSLSSKPDFSDTIDDSGKSVPRG